MNLSIFKLTIVQNFSKGNRNKGPYVRPLNITPMHLLLDAHFQKSFICSSLRIFINTVINDYKVRLHRMRCVAFRSVVFAAACRSMHQYTAACCIQQHTFTRRKITQNNARRRNAAQRTGSGVKERERQASSRTSSIRTKLFIAL